MAGTRTNGVNGHGPRPPAAREARETAEPRKRKESLHSHPALSALDARRIAVEALCDHRSVYAYLHGHSQSAMMRARVERAMNATGFSHLVGYATKTAAVRAQNKAAQARVETDEGKKP